MSRPTARLAPVAIGAAVLGLLLTTGCSTRASGHGALAPSSTATSGPTTSEPTRSPGPPVPPPDPALPTATAGSTGGAPVKLRLHVGQRLLIQGEKEVSSVGHALVEVRENTFQAVRTGTATVGGAADVPPPPCASKGCSYAMPGQLVEVTVVR